jgi:hypothetical protein
MSLYYNNITNVTIRYAFPDDALALMRLAELDSSEPPSQPMLVAEVEGELRAALSLRDRAAVADPFHRTAALVDLLCARADQLAARDRSVETTARSRSPRAVVARFRGNA